MGPSVYPGMGAVLARAWTDEGFRERLLEDGAAALRGIGIVVRPSLEVVAHEGTPNLVHLALSAPPVVAPASPLSDIGDFGSVYRQPALWSLNWLGRDPVASRRFLNDPEAALGRLGIAVPEGLAVRAVANTPDTLHLILPHRPPAERCTATMLGDVAAGRWSRP